MKSNMQNTYLLFQKYVNFIKKDYEKVKKETFDESSWSTQGSKINNNIKIFQKCMDDLTKKVIYIKENCLETQFDSTLKQIEPALDKAKNTTIPQIQAINDKTKHFGSNFESDTIEEQDNGITQNQVVLMDLMNQQEVLDGRKKELETIHKTAAMLKATTDKMAVDITNQGEMLDEIEQHVEDAEHNAQKAKQEITKANELSKGNRKKMCCLIFIILVTVGAITAILLSLIL